MDTKLPEDITSHIQRNLEVWKEATCDLSDCTSGGFYIEITNTKLSIVYDRNGLSLSVDNWKNMTYEQLITALDNTEWSK